MTFYRPTHTTHPVSVSAALIKELKAERSDARALALLTKYAKADFDAKARSSKAGAMGTQEDQGSSLIYAVVFADRAGLVRAALDLGQGIDELGPDGETPLGVACASEAFGEKSSACALALLKAGASPHKENKLGEAPIHLAASSGMLEACRELVRRGADINHAGGVFKDTPLLRAVQSMADQGEPLNDKSEAILTGLLELGAEIGQARSKLSRDALAWAVYALGHESLIRWLIKKGSDVNRQDASGRTPLRTACLQGSCANLEASAIAMLELGANPWIEDGFGYSCMSSHHSSSDNPRMKALIKSWVEASELRAEIAPLAARSPPSKSL